MGTIAGVATCALLHWAFPNVTGTRYLDAAIVGVAAAVGVWLDLSGPKK